MTHNIDANHLVRQATQIQESCAQQQRQHLFFFESPYQQLKKELNFLSKRDCPRFGGLVWKLQRGDEGEKKKKQPNQASDTNSRWLAGLERLGRKRDFFLL